MFGSVNVRHACLYLVSDAPDARGRWALQPGQFSCSVACCPGSPLAVSDQFTLFRIPRSDVWLAVSPVSLLATSFLGATALSVVLAAGESLHDGCIKGCSLFSVVVHRLFRLQH